MTNEELRRDLSLHLVNAAQTKGYVTIDEVFELVDAAALPIDEVDRLCEMLDRAGVIFRDDDPISARVVPSDDVPDDDGPDDTIHDRSRLDYGALLDRVAEIDPSLTEYVEAVRRITPPRRREEATLIQHARDGNPYARERLISMYLRVAMRHALWYHEKYGLPLDETLQDASIGLILALQKMPSTGEYRFSTYAPWWIRQYIARETQGLSKYRVPVHMKEKLFAVARIYCEHEWLSTNDQGLVNEAVITVSSDLGIDIGLASHYLRLVIDPLSIDEQAGGGESCLFSDGNALEDEMIDAVSLADEKTNLRELMRVLKPRERDILEWRYGLRDGETHTLDDLGRMFGLTRARVGQIEHRALRRLQRAKSAGKRRAV